MWLKYYLRLCLDEIDALAQAHMAVHREQKFFRRLTPFEVTGFELH